MTKQRNIIVWAILVLLVTSCSSPPTGVAECNASVQINEPDIVAPGEKVFLTLNKTGFGWVYSWATTAGDFDKPDASSTQFTAPADEKTVTVSVKVVNDQGCSYTDNIQVKVENPPDVVAEETAVIETAVDPTATLTLEPSVTSTATFTPTIEASATPEPSPLPEPTATTSSTVAEQPTMPSTPIPIIPNDISVTLINAENRGNSFNLSWTYEGTLGTDMAFAVRVGRPGDVHSRFWDTEPPYEYSLAVGSGTEFEEGDFEWYVVVVLDLVPDGSGADGKWVEITRSNTATFYVPFMPTPNPPVSIP